MKNKHLIVSALAAFAWAGFSSPAQAHDHCGSFHHYHGGYSSFGFSFVFPLFYSRPTPVYEEYYEYAPSYRSYDDPMVQVQIALARRGYYRGTIDGIVGAATRSAIRRYQYDQGYPVTGRVDSTLLRMLCVR